MSTKLKGGKRQGAGRKPIPEPERKKAIILYVQNKKIVQHGGEDKLKRKLTNVIDNI